MTYLKHKTTHSNFSSSRNLTCPSFIYPLCIKRSDSLNMNLFPFLILCLLCTQASVVLLETDTVLVDPHGCTSCSGSFDVIRKAQNNINQSALYFSFSSLKDDEGNSWTIAPFVWSNANASVWIDPIINQTESIQMIRQTGQTDSQRNPFFQWSFQLNQQPYTHRAYNQTDSSFWTRLPESNLEFSFSIRSWPFSSTFRHLTFALKTRIKLNGKDRSDVRFIPKSATDKTGKFTTKFHLIAGILSSEQRAWKDGKEWVNVTTTWNANSQQLEWDFPGPFQSIEYDPVLSMDPLIDDSMSHGSPLAAGEWGFNLVFFGSAFFCFLVAFLIYHYHF